MHTPCCLDPPGCTSPANQTTLDPFCSYSTNPSHHDIVQANLVEKTAQEKGTNIFDDVMGTDVKVRCPLSTGTQKGKKLILLSAMPNVDDCYGQNVTLHIQL